MSNEGENPGAGEAPAGGSEHKENEIDTKPKRKSKRASMSARKASIFIGNEGNKIPVQIVGVATDDLEKSADNVIVPPDGGYGYVIVFAAFFSNVIVDGIVFSFGSLKDSIHAAGKGKLDQATVAWVGSLLTGFYLLTGPFVSAVANRYGFRVVAIAGSLISSGAFILSYLLNKDEPNIAILIALYGVIGGIGFGCIYVPAVIAVGFYFEKKRALATGIALCGSGIGNFVFPPLISKLVEKYKWNGAILILGLIVLACAFLGILYRPLKPKKSNKRKSIFNHPESAPDTPLLMRIKRAKELIKWDTINSFISTKESLLNVNIHSHEDIRARAEKLYNQARRYSALPEKESHPIVVPPSDPGIRIRKGSIPTMLSKTGESPSFPQAAGVLVNVPSKAPTLKAKNFNGIPNLNEIEESHGSQNFAEDENLIVPQNVLEDRAIGETRNSPKTNRNLAKFTCRIGNSMLTEDEMTNSRIIQVSSKIASNKALYRDEFYYSGTLVRIPEHANKSTTQAELAPAVETGDGNEKSTRKKCCDCGMAKKLLDFSLLMSPTFLVFSISGMFSMLGLFVPFVYLTDQAYSALKEHNSDVKKSELTILISLIGAANTVGRILSGWIADRPFINALILNNVAVTVMGISTLAVPFLSSHFLFILYSCVFGISMACFASLRSILVVELLGLAKLTNAFGLLLLFAGIASMVATPLAGTLAVKGMGGESDFSIAFYTAGGFLVFSAIMCYPLSRISRWEEGRKKTKSANVEAVA